MYYISNSMPKSASTLVYRLTTKAIVSTFGINGQRALFDAIKNGELPGGGGFVRNCSTSDVLRKLQTLSEKKGPFAVKAHVPLTAPLRDAIESGHVRVTYIYRDPRDAMLSAMSNYQQTKDTERVEFSAFDTLDAALRKYVKIAQTAVAWKESGRAIILRYEEFINDMVGAMDRVMRELGVIVSQEQLSEHVIAATELQKRPGLQERPVSNLRFNKGVAGRFRTELSPEDLEKSTMALDKWLRILGYDP